MKSPATDPGFSCILDEPKRRKRRFSLERSFKNAPFEIKELTDGFEIQLSPDPIWLKKIYQLIEFERVCCPFVKFVLSIEPSLGMVSLKLTGADGVKEVLRDWIVIPEKCGESNESLCC